MQQVIEFWAALMVLLVFLAGCLGWGAFLAWASDRSSPVGRVAWTVVGFILLIPLLALFMAAE